MILANSLILWEAKKMSNEVFVAFWGGLAGGVAIGIVIAAILSAIANSIDRRDNQ